MSDKSGYIAALRGMNQGRDSTTALRERVDGYVKSGSSPSQTGTDNKPIASKGSEK